MSTARVLTAVARQRDVKLPVSVGDVRRALRAVLHHRIRERIGANRAGLYKKLLQFNMQGGPGGGIDVGKKVLYNRVPTANLDAIDLRVLTGPIRYKLARQVKHHRAMKPDGGKILRNALAGVGAELRRERAKMRVGPQSLRNASTRLTKRDRRAEDRAHELVLEFDQRLASRNPKRPRR